MSVQTLYAQKCSCHDFEIFNILFFNKIYSTYTWIKVKDNNAAPDDIPIQLCGVKKNPLFLQYDNIDNNVYQIVNLNNFQGFTCDPCKKCENKTRMLNLFNSSSILVSYVSINNQTECNYNQLIYYNSNNATIAIIFALNGPFNVSAQSNIISVFVPTDLATNLNV